MTKKENRISETIETGIIRRTSGDKISYVFTVPCGMDSNGKQIRKTTTWKPDAGMTLKKSDKKAKEEYFIFKNKCLGNYSLNENMRFKDLCEEYFRIYAPHNLKPITMYNYQKMVEDRCMKFLGNKKLKEISTGMLTEFFNNMVKLDYEGNVIPLGHRTVKRYFTVLQSIMHYAEKQKYIKETPCKGVILPKKDATEEERRKYLTEDELPEFINLFDVNKSDFDRIILILLHTGMRSGEVLGLSWSDIDFDQKTITVNHTLSDVGGKHFLTTPKTKTSRRTIFMNETVSNILITQKEYQMEVIQLLDDFAHPEMVFTSSLGNYKDRSCLNTSFRRFLKNTPFDFMTLHCLRHTNATLLLNSGIDLKIVSDHLGHSDISTTGNIYADVLSSSRKKTSEILDSLLSK